MAIYRPCRHRIFARHAGATSRKALETANAIVTVSRARKGRSGHDLGETATGPEVKFTEWTSAGEMRHPVFLGLREDKRAEDVVLEKEKSRARKR